MLSKMEVFLFCWKWICGGTTLSFRTASLLLGTLVGWEVVPNILENRPVDVGTAAESRSQTTERFTHLFFSEFQKQMFWGFFLYIAANLQAKTSGQLAKEMVNTKQKKKNLQKPQQSKAVEEQEKPDQKSAGEAVEVGGKPWRETQSETGSRPGWWCQLTLCPSHPRLGNVGPWCDHCWHELAMATTATEESIKGLEDSSVPHELEGGGMGDKEMWRLLCIYNVLISFNCRVQQTN